jgi:hypothetical protein
MTPNDDDDKRRCLDAEQKIDAKQMIGCGWAIPNVARHYGLTESQLRCEIGLPQWQREPKQDRQRTLFDCEGSR